MIVLSVAVVGLGMVQKQAKLVMVEAPQQVDYLALSGGKLDDWVGWWQNLIPGFTLKQMGLSGSAEIGNDVSGTWQSQAGDLEEPLYIYSPNRRYLVDMISGEAMIGEKDGKIVGYFGPDQEVTLADTREGVSKRIAFCGTHCGYDGAVWLNDNVLVLAGYNETDLDVKTGATLVYYDLTSQETISYTGPEVDTEVFKKYRQENPVGFEKRLRKYLQE